MRNFLNCRLIQLWAFDVARIGRACGARCGIKAELLWSNGGGSRNPAKPGFVRRALRTGQKPPRNNSFSRL